MLLEFSVTNYRSFREKTTLSMLADEAKEEHPENIATISPKLKVLKSAVIYGANASGKSNFMKALQALRNLILSSTQNKPNQIIKEYEPYLFDTESFNKTTIFEITFLVEQIRYEYLVSFTKKSIEQEYFYSFPHNRQTTLFERQNNNTHFGESLKGQKKVIADLTAKNQLFLSKAFENNFQQLIPIYHFFNDSFMAIPFLDSWIDSVYIHKIADELIKQQYKPFYNNFKKIIQSFDTGIVDFKIIRKKPSIGVSSFIHLSNYKIETSHISYDCKNKEIEETYLSIEEESTGTQKLFVLGGLILRALMNGRVIMIDEFERSIHPHISQFILRMFNDPQINTKNAQLIFATHDTNLLAKSNDLRRDQICLVEKDSYGASELFSLADIEGIRKDTPFEKWYLSGRFGGVPSVQELNFKLNYQAQ